jgi:gliding motility-associated-like protein
VIGWDGKYKGAELPSGDYWHVLKLIIKMIINL